MNAPLPRTIIGCLLLLSACAGPTLPPEGVDAGVDAAEAPDLGSASPVVFLPDDRYKELLAIDPGFPYGVTGKYSTRRPILGARWGRHGGPMVTSRQQMPAQVHRFMIPAEAEAEVGGPTTPVAAPAGAPAMAFFGDLVDLPGDRFSLTSYTGMGAAFPGEALLYNQDLSQVVGRAHVNGFFAAVALRSGGSFRILYPALSGLSATASMTSDNGLYGSELCGDDLLPKGACPPGKKIFGWAGFSGPISVSSDAHGSVLVAASLSMGASSDAIYALTKEEALGSGGAAPALLVAANTQGTASLAALSPEGAAPGFAVAKGYDDFMAKKAAPAYAQGYRQTGAKIEKDGARIDKALAPGPSVEEMSLFSDPKGDLWVALKRTSDGVFLRLARRPAR